MVFEGLDDTLNNGFHRHQGTHRTGYNIEEKMWELTFRPLPWMAISLNLA